MSTPNDHRPFDQFDLSSPDHYDVADTILPMVERAASACEGLSRAAKDLERRDQELESAIPRVEALIDQARLHLTGKPGADASRRAISREDVQSMIDWAVAGVEARMERRVEQIAGDMTRLSHDLAAKVAGLAAMLALSKDEPERADERANIERAMAPILATFESQMLELIDAFRSRAEQAGQSIEGMAEDHASRLESLCKRAERLLAVGESGVMDVIDELSTTIRPFKDAIIEGKNGVEIHGPLADVLTQMRAELRAELAGVGKVSKPTPVVRTTTKKPLKPARKSKAA